jgi:transposase InsO family protein
MAQVARELSGFDGFLTGKSHLLMDRDSKYTAQFHRILRDAGVKPLLLPPCSPNLNAHAERFVRTIKEECLDRLIFFGQGMLCRAIDNFMEHYHTERNHQGLGNKIIAPDRDIGRLEGEVVCQERLGGLLKYYHRAAA